MIVCFSMHTAKVKKKNPQSQIYIVNLRPFALREWSTYTIYFGKFSLILEGS